MPLFWPIDEIIGDRIDRAKKQYEELTSNVAGAASVPLVLDQARRQFDQATEPILSRVRDGLNPVTAVSNIGRSALPAADRATEPLMSAARSRFDSALEPILSDFRTGYAAGEAERRSASAERRLEAPRGANPVQAAGQMASSLTGPARDTLEPIARRTQEGATGVESALTGIGVNPTLSRVVGSGSALLGGVQGATMGSTLESATRNVGLPEPVAQVSRALGEGLAPTGLKGDVFGNLTRARAATAGLGATAGAGIGAMTAGEDASPGDRALGALRGGLSGLQVGSALPDLAGAARSASRALPKSFDLAGVPAGAALGAATGPEDQTPLQRAGRAVVGGVLGPGVIRSTRGLLDLGRTLDNLAVLRAVDDPLAEFGDAAKIADTIEYKLERYNQIEQEIGELQNRYSAMDELAAGRIEQPSYTKGSAFAGRRFSEADLYEIAERAGVNPSKPNWWQEIDPENVRLYRDEAVVRRGPRPLTPKQQAAALRRQERALVRERRSLEQQLEEHYNRLDNEVPEATADAAANATPPRDPGAEPPAPRAPDPERVQREVDEIGAIRSDPNLTGQQKKEAIKAVFDRNADLTPEDRAALRRGVPKKRDAAPGPGQQPLIPGAPRTATQVSPAPPPREPEPGRVQYPPTEGMRPQSAVPVRPDNDAPPTEYARHYSRIIQDMYRDGVPAERIREIMARGDPSLSPETEAARLADTDWAMRDAARATGDFGQRELPTGEERQAPLGSIREEAQPTVYPVGEEGSSGFGRVGPEEAPEPARQLDDAELDRWEEVPPFLRPDAVNAQLSGRGARAAGSGSGAPPPPPPRVPGGATPSPQLPPRPPSSMSQPQAQAAAAAAKAATDPPPPSRWAELASKWNQARYSLGILSSPVGGLRDTLFTAPNLVLTRARIAGAAAAEGAFRVPSRERSATFSMLRGFDEGMAQGARQAALEFGQVLRDGKIGDELAISGDLPEPLITGSGLKGWVGRTAEFGYRLRLASDRFYTTMGNQMASVGLAYREADRAGLAKDTPEYAAYVRKTARDIQTAMARQAQEAASEGRRVTQGTVKPRRPEPAVPPGYPALPTADADVESLAKEAFQISRRLVYQQDPGTLTGAAGHARGVSALSTLIPLYRTIANMGAQAISYHPLAGTVGAIADVARSGANKGVGAVAGPYGAGNAGAGHILTRTGSTAVLPLSQRLADSVLVGGSVAALGAALAAQNIITDTGPADASVRRRMMDEGWRPLSVQTPDGYVPLGQVFGPLALPLAFGVTTQQEMSKGKDIDTNAAWRFVQVLMDSQQSQWFQQSGLRDFYEVLNAIGSPDPDEQKRSKERLLSGVFNQWFAPMSGAARTMTAMSDGTIRDPRGLMERYFALYPGLSGLVPERTTETGEVSRRGPGETGLMALSPVTMTQRTQGQRKFTGSEDAAMDAEITRAISAVRNYRRDPDQYKAPTPRQEDLYWDYAGSADPFAAQSRREERVRRRQRSLGEGEGPLASIIGSRGGGGVRFVAPGS